MRGARTERTCPSNTARSRCSRTRVIVWPVVSFTNITERKQTEEHINGYFDGSSYGLLVLSSELLDGATLTAASMIGLVSEADLHKLSVLQIPPFSPDKLTRDRAT